MEHSQTKNILTSAEMVLDTARKRATKRKPVVAVAGAEDTDVLKAVSDANTEGIVDALLVFRYGIQAQFVHDFVIIIDLSGSQQIRELLLHGIDEARLAAVEFLDDRGNGKYEDHAVVPAPGPCLRARRRERDRKTPGALRV